jgi:hypothetical protein
MQILSIILGKKNTKPLTKQNSLMYNNKASRKYKNFNLITNSQQNLNSNFRVF